MPATINGVVFNDLNNNGIRDLGEPGIEGVQVVLFQPDGTCLSKTTDSSGIYVFSDLKQVGDYKVYETARDTTQCPPEALGQPSGYSVSTTLRVTDVTVTANDVSGNIALPGGDYGHNNEATFLCKAVGYQVAGFGSSEFAEINLVTGKVTVISSLGIQVNALGYNPVDNFIYAINNTPNPNELIRINPDGTVTNLGPVPNLPNIGFNNGTFDEDGHYFLYASETNRYYVIDLNPSSPTYGQLVDPTAGYVLDTSPYGTPLSNSSGILDWAYNPVTGLLYGINPSSGNVQSVDPTTGKLTGFNTTGTASTDYGATFFDKNGIFYAIRNNTGRIDRIIISGNSASAEQFSQSLSSGNNDGASCIGAVIEVDFGDAPDISAGNGPGNYTTLLENNGPRHQIISKLYLGSQVTAELDAYQNADATGDDLIKGIQDDGLVIDGNNCVNVVINQGTYTLSVQTTNNTTTDATIYGWVDFNKDGIFQDTEFATAIVPAGTTTATPINLTFTIPAGTTEGITFTRLRLTTDKLINTGQPGGIDTRSIGAASDGEVEDYRTCLITRNLKVVKAADKAFAEPGDTITYTTTLSNIGKTPMTNVSFVDAIPAGTTYANNLNVTGSTFTGTDPQTGLTIDSIPAGGSVTVSFDVTIGDTIPDPNPILNTSTATEPGQTPIESNEVSTQVNTAELSPLTKTVDLATAQVGDELTYTLTFTNTGNVDATNVVLTDPIPNGTSYVAASITSTVAITGDPTTSIQLTNPVAPNKTVTVSFKVKIDSFPDPNPIPNTATLNWKYIVNPTGQPTTGNTTSNEVTTQVNQGTLTASKSVDKTVANLGDTIRYTVTLGNTGKAPITNVSFVDAIPAGTTYANNLTVTGSSFIGSNPATGLTIASIPVGGSVTVSYTVTLGNTGKAPITNVSFVDAIPAGTTYANNLTVTGSSFIGSNPATGLTIASIPVGGSVTVSWDVLIGNTVPNPNPIPNKATATPQGGKPTTTNEVTTTVTGEADLQPLVKSVDKTEAAIGDILTYTLTSTNIGDVPANNVVITDPIPAGTVYIANSVSGNVSFTGEPATGIQLTNPVKPGETVTITFQVRVTMDVTTSGLPVQNPIPNKANIRYTYIPAPGQPPVTETGTSNTVTTSVNFADLSPLMKSVDKAYADIGEEVTYTLTFTNTGNVPANNVFLTDPVPNGTSYVVGSLVANVPVTGSPLTTINLNNSVAPGQTVIIRFKVVVNEIPVPNPFVNQATVQYQYTAVTGKPPITQTKPSNPVTTEVRHGEIPTTGPDATKKVADRVATTEGEVITYTVKAKNTGNTPINNVILTDVVPVGTSYLSGTTTINGLATGQSPVTGVNVGTLQPGQETTITFKVSVLDNAPNPIKNTATFNYSYIVDPTKPPVDREIKTNEANVANLKPNIEIIKSADRSGVVKNDIITYTLVVRNTGNFAASNVVIADPLPLGLEYIGNLTINGTPVAGNITQGITIASIAPAQQVVITFRAKVTDIADEGSVFINDATARYQYKVNPDGPVITDNTKSNQVKITGYPTPVTVTKNTDQEVVKKGDTFTYTMVVKNDAALDAETMLIQDTLPPQLQVQQVRVDGQVVQGDIKQGILVSGLPKGEQMVIEMDILAVDVLSEPFKNVFNATLYFRPDPNRSPVGQTDSAEDTGEPGRDPNKPYPGVWVIDPELTLIKVADKEEYVVGELVHYTVDVTNTGNVNALDVTVNDLLHPQFEFMTGSVTVDGMARPDADILTGIKLGNIKVGESVRITFDTKVIAAGVIPNQTTAQYVYKEEPDGPDFAGSNNSNVEVIRASEVDLEVVKQANVDFANLGDEIEYTVTIRNLTTITATNILFKDELPRNVELVPDSFKVNGKLVRNVNLEKGVNIGDLEPMETAVITYRVEVISSLCNGQIINGAWLNYNYILPDGSVGNKTLEPEGAAISVVDMGISSFKQLSIESYLGIPQAKPDVEAINIATGTIDIKNCHVIQTSINHSIENQRITGYKLIVHGVLKLVVEYTALDTVQSVHSAHYSVPFSTFVVLPQDYQPGSKLEVEGIVEDIYYNLVDIRTFFHNTTALINVKILFC